MLNLISAFDYNIAQSLTVNTPTYGSIIAALFAIIALMISAFVSGSEIAFFSISQQQREELKDNKKGELVTNLLSTPEKLLATILITNNLVNVTIVVLCNYIMNQILVFSSDLVSFIFQTVILTFLILLFGEILPKLYATNHNLRFALFASHSINLLCTIFKPLSKLLIRSTFIVNKIVSTHEDEISKEDLSQALEMTHVKAGDDKQLLEGILKFGGTTVTEVMKPRVDIIDIDIASGFDKVVEIVINTGYSRLPVYEDNPDNIKGILYAKDLLPYIGKAEKNFNWQRLLREAYFVPETRMIDDLLEDFRKKKIHMAIVVDEFGGTQGIATLEDVLEEIVGDIDDEYDTEEKSYKKLKDNTYIFDGKTLLNDFFKVTKLSESDFEPVCEDVETLAGLLLEIKGDFPKEKEPITFGKCNFLVLDIDKHRIASIKVKIDSPENEKMA
ncbi:MAG: gliding motility-associated protein GldE [Muribaculaceae bacterium]|nr:gliding motility-associated protein GldE [Muribaculaceae bacterium]